MKRLLPLLSLLPLLLAVLTACTGSSTPSSSPPTSATPSATPTVVAPAPKPRVGSCHRLSYADALAPTDTTSSVPCSRPHTTVTFAVGSLDSLGAVVDGHLSAVDSSRIGARLAATCRDRLAAYTGGAASDLRTSMLRTVWFSPALDAADAGQSWWRCDVTVLAAEDRLVSLRRPTSLRRALSADGWRAAYGMCGTADPATPRFQRVVCSRPHTWEAVGVGGSTNDCEAPARARATDPLKVTWSYEPPSKADRAQGETSGICWTPSA